jgi:hypothetical protein
MGSGVFGLSVLIICSLAFAATAGAGNPANSNKPYSIVICGGPSGPGGQIGCSSANPAVIAPGGTATFPSTLSVTFTNDNKLGSGIQLGSDNLNVPNPPSGFSVISTSLPQCPATFNNQAPACVTLLNGGTTVGFRNLNLAPGQSISITLSALTPPLSPPVCTTALPCSWTDEAKQSNDFSGTGNDLNPDGTSAYGTVTTAVASCPKNQKCVSTLADGGTGLGTPTGSGGSVSVTVNTGPGKTAGTQIEALDFGQPLDSNLCPGVTALHFESWNVSNGSDRSETVSITTTPYSGYQPQVCYFTTKQFTALEPTNGVPNPCTSAVSNGECLALASPTKIDGTPGYQGLLADCGTKPLPPLTVDCSKNPGVTERGVGNPIVGPFTTVIAVPPGFDAKSFN